MTHPDNEHLWPSAIAISVLKRYAGWEGRPERDSNGDWFVGWGHYGDDFPHERAWLLSPELADEFLTKDLMMLREAVLAEHGDEPLTQEQFDGLMLDMWGQQDGFGNGYLSP